MLDRLLEEIPVLTGAVVRSDVRGNGSYDATKTGAADAVRDAGEAISETARGAGSTAKRSARKARKVPGVAQAEGQVKGALASEGDLAIAGYGKLTAEEIVDKLSGLSQVDLAKIDAYERKNENRKTILSRVTSLRGEEPWPGYDELSVSEIRAVLGEGDEGRVKRARAYERSHKNRAGVIDASEHELAKASANGPNGGRAFEAPQYETTMGETTSERRSGRGSSAGNGQAGTPTVRPAAVGLPVRISPHGLLFAS